jgi:hypothetical protein
MGKYFLVGLYSVSLSLLLCVSGCFEAGGMGMYYGPPKNIACGNPWIISVGYYVVPVDPKEKHGKLTERIKDVVIYIHYSSDNNFIAVPMVVERVNPKTGELQMAANMPPIPCDSGIEYVAYYINDMSDNHYNQSKYYIVPVSNK